MIVFVDIISDKDICSDSYPHQKLCEGAVVALESKKIETGGDAEVDIGANASKEEEEEKLDAAEKKTVINIVHAHELQKIDLSKKDFKSFMKTYWAKLKEAIDKKRIEALGDEFKNPAEGKKVDKDASEKEKKKQQDEIKKEVAKAEKAALEKLQKSGKKSEVQAYNDMNARLESYKNNFVKLQNFVKDEIEANFDEFEFYIPNEASLGSCALIPARYIGEALSPTFYLFVDGIVETKY